MANIEPVAYVLARVDHATNSAARDRIEAIRTFPAKDLHAAEAYRESYNRSKQPGNFSFRIYALTEVAAG